MVLSLNGVTKNRVGKWLFGFYIRVGYLMPNLSHYILEDKPFPGIIFKRPRADLFAHKEFQILQFNVYMQLNGCNYC